MFASGRYWTRLFSQSLAKGQEYAELPPTIMIASLNYPLFSHETDHFHTVFHIREDEGHFLWSHHSILNFCFSFLIPL
uniref:PD-(D/E)XK nuclease family transposase n=1 Tax=Anoxybacteroides tepidamans TaxID=265948 RepID=UPI00160635C8|nr:PD-(D/E)XK nuclease family transposase [Anoxybacillus tepidamans]